MPYIKQEDRKKFYEVLDQMPVILVKGELEYCMTKIMKKFMENKEANYSNLHDCVYGCIHAGHEFERNYLDKREDFAKEKNGDV